MDMEATMTEMTEEEAILRPQVQSISRKVLKTLMIKRIKMVIMGKVAEKTETETVVTEMTIVKREIVRKTSKEKLSRSMMMLWASN